MADRSGQPPQADPPPPANAAAAVADAAAPVAAAVAAAPAAAAAAVPVAAAQQRNNPPAANQAAAPGAAANHAGRPALAADGARRAAGGRRPNRRNYTPDELASLNEVVEELLPISGAEWEQVEHRHYSRYPDRERTGVQLRKKFNDTAKTNIPTGDPNIPDHVREAKRIRGLIYEKTEGGTGSPSEGFGLQLGPDDDIEVASINQGDNGAVEDAHFGGGGVVAGGGGDVGGVAGANGGQNRVRSRSLSTTPTPISNRRPRRNNEEGPSFNDVFLMMMRQQQQDRRDEQERQRRADAQLQMQNTMMQTMMMAVLGGNSGMPIGNMMSQMAGNLMQPNGAAVAPANGAEENRRMTGRERNEARQMERQRAADEAAISREESIQAALAADPNMTREELERMIAEGERENNEAR